MTTDGISYGTLRNIYFMLLVLTVQIKVPDNVA